MLPSAGVSPAARRSPWSTERSTSKVLNDRSNRAYAACHDAAHRFRPRERRRGLPTRTRPGRCRCGRRRTSIRSGWTWTSGQSSRGRGSGSVMSRRCGRRAATSRRRWPACRSLSSGTGPASCAPSTTSASTGRTNCCRARAPRVPSCARTTPGCTTSTARCSRARHTDRMPDFDRTEICLDRIRVEEFGGFVYVNLDAGSAPLGEQAPDLAAEIARWAPDVAGADLRETADLRRQVQLEERHRQLPGVLPLPHRAPGVRRAGRHGHLRGADARHLVKPLRRGRQAREPGVRRLRCLGHPARGLVAVAEHLPAALPGTRQLHGLPGRPRRPRPDPGDLGLLLRDGRDRGRRGRCGALHRRGAPAAGHRDCGERPARDVDTGLRPGSDRVRTRTGQGCPSTACTTSTASS